jgi:hypothetical protein
MQLVEGGQILVGQDVVERAQALTKLHVQAAVLEARPQYPFRSPLVAMVHGLRIPASV